MAESLSRQLLDSGAEHLILWRDAASGLEAVLVLDDLTLGPAAGGIRTWRYPSLEDAAADAMGLARSMTLKCALAGLDAGGGKAVILDHAGLDRARAFDVVGQKVESLGGLFRTAGDLGTTAADLEVAARRTSYVHLGERGLAEAVARGHLRTVEAALAVLERRELLMGARLEGRTAVVQGAGMIGRAVAETLAMSGAAVRVADVDDARARAVADAVGGTVVASDTALFEEVDIVAPCAIGGVIDATVARALRCRVVAGAANGILRDEAAGRVLAERGIVHIPDVIASAGAVIDGIGASVMGLGDRTELIDRLGVVAWQVLVEARDTKALPLRIAELKARQRLAHARAARGS